MSLSFALLVVLGSFTPEVEQQFATPSGRPTLQIGVLSPQLTGELSTSVLAWALSQRETYKLPGASTLRFSHAFATRFGASFHLVQTIDGIDIDDAKLVVTLDENARVVQVSSSIVAFDVAKTSYSFDASTAMRKAAAGVVLPALRLEDQSMPYGGTKQLAFVIGPEVHAGYLVHVSTLDFTKNMYVAVDGVTGERLFVQNRVHHALDAQVYPISPGGLDAGVGKTATVAVQLKHSDGGSMVSTTCEALQADGGWLISANTDQKLCGTQMTQYNCCPREGCRADAGPKTVNVSTSMGGIGLELSIAQCDRLRRASPQTNDAGQTYVYRPVDPPANLRALEVDDPAYSDEFAEVHSFYHVNKVYDWVRGLSATAQPIFNGQPAVLPFAMRDERKSPARKPAIWSNVLFPDTNDLIANIENLPGCLFSPPCRSRSTKLNRIDNAAFLPHEGLEQFPFPGFDTGVDTLLIFQGAAADAAYDATVIQHEFGHGVVYATAGLSIASVAFDSRSANNEGGALHEAFSDYIAGAFNDVAIIGPYFGPRVVAAAQAGAATDAGASGIPQDGYLRSLNNTSSCPTVLWGETHQDSEHVSAALWAGRSALRGADNGNTYDAAFYAMLVSLSPTADFAQMAAAMTARVKTAFPSVANAEAQMAAIFQGKGVVGCSKVIEASDAGVATRPYFAMASLGTGQSPEPLVPGAAQFKFRTPKGASKLRVTATNQTQSTTPGATVDISILAKLGSPITFVKNGNTVTNDSTQSAKFTGTDALTATLDGLAAPCGETSEVYVAVAAVGGAAVSRLNITVDPADSCPLPSGGTATGTPARGCGCSSTEVMPMLTLVAAALAFRRRQRR